MTNTNDVSSSVWRSRPRRRSVAAVAAFVLVAGLGACGRASNETAGAAGLAGLAKTWHNIAPAPVSGSGWSWPIVDQMTFSDQGRWDFTLTDGTTCHTEYRLSAVSDTRADLASAYFKCPPQIDGYLGLPTPYPLELRDGQLVASGAGTATFAEGPATVAPSSTTTAPPTPSTTSPPGTSRASSTISPVGNWSCTIASDLRGSTIDITLQRDTWSSTYTYRSSSRPPEVSEGSGHWQATDSQGTFGGTVQNTGKKPPIDIPLDYTVELEDKSEILPFIAVAIYKANGPSGAAQKYWSTRHVTIADRTSAGTDHQREDFAPVYDDARRDRGDTTPPRVYDGYYQGPDEFVIGNLRCTRQR